jgi:hypothetical protein
MVLRNRSDPVNMPQWNNKRYRSKQQRKTEFILVKVDVGPKHA